MSRQSAYTTERPSLAYAGKSITANYAPTSYGQDLQITPLSVKKAESIQAVWTSFDVIVDVLQKITDGNEADRQTQTQALGLRKRMHSLDFIVAIMFMKNIAYKTKSLVVHLQTVELNILDASGLVEAIPYASWRKFERTTT